MAVKKTKRSAFDNSPAPVPGETPAKIPGETTNEPVHLGSDGTKGIKLAGKQPGRKRSWEREHQFGKGYSVKGVRPDMQLWLVETADSLNVRLAEVAVYALRYSMDLVDSGELKVKTSLDPRAALMTLFPKGYDQSGGEGVKAAIKNLDGRDRAAKEKGKKKKKKEAGKDWRNKTITWNQFDQDLKKRIVDYCRDHVSQGEFVTYLLERARADYQAGLLVFRPQPKTVAGRLEESAS
jgi:hypothetical protein